MASYGDERCFGNAMSEDERDEEGTQLLLARALSHLTVRNCGGFVIAAAHDGAEWCMSRRRRR
jgi:hypothetical protein